MSTSTVPAPLVREWAEGQGITEGYGKRGRVSNALKAAFLKAHPVQARKIAAGETLTDPARASVLPAASTVRPWAEANYESGYGSRGRLSAGIMVEYLRAHPATAREVAAAVGLPVASRGRISADLAWAIYEAAQN